MRTAKQTWSFGLLGIVLAAAVAGCGSTADCPYGDTGCASGSGGDPYTLTSLDAACGSVTGKMVLAAFAAEYSATLTYAGGEPNAGSKTPLTLRTRYDGGTITCYPPFSPPPGSAAPSEPAHVTVAIELDFATGDGAFNETLAATADGWQQGTATVGARVDADKIAGTYDPQLAGLTNPGVSFSGTCTPQSTTGNVMKGGTNSGGVGEVDPVASW